MEQDNLLKKGFGAVDAGKKGHRGTIGAATTGVGAENGDKQRSSTIKGKPNEAGGSGFGGNGLENVLDLDGGVTQEDIIANVEMMLQSEQKKNDAMKKDKKKAGAELDLNQGILIKSGSSKTAQGTTNAKAG
jgi:hypothetical protein